MKDAYSFDLDFEGAKAAYNRMFVSYLRTFTRMGLQAIPMRADTGPIGGDLSHEFIILAETGESQVFCHRDYLALPVPGAETDFGNDGEIDGIVKQWTTPYAATEEMHDEAAWDAVPEADKVSARGIEVGHIFHFGEKYSKPMGAKVMGPDGMEHFVSMGSYGIGPSRLIAAIIEASHDENGIIWPEAVAPFDIGLINMKVGDAECDRICDEAYKAFEAAGKDVLYDDTDQRAGGKFATADLIGLPWQVIVGPRGAAAGEGRDQEPQDRRARNAAGGCRTRQAGRQGMSQVTAAKPAGAGPFSVFERMVAWRYLRSKRKETVISVIASISFLGIMLGVATLIVVMAVMNGFRAELLTRILGVNGHLVVTAIDTPLEDYSAVADRINGVAGVKYAIPLVEGQVLAQGNVGAGAGALVRGIRGSDLGKVTLVANNIKQGSIVGFDEGEGVVIGKRMAENMGLVLGDSIR
ncbi:hypothetical protein GCM10023067_47590 [Aminobacter aganoensis]